MTPPTSSYLNTATKPPTEDEVLEIVLLALCAFTTAWAIANFALALKIDAVRNEALRMCVGYIINGGVAALLLTHSLADGTLDTRPEMGDISFQSIMLLILTFLSALEASQVRRLRERATRRSN